MSQTVKRVLNAFVSGTLSAALTIALLSWTDLTAAVQAEDWVSLKGLGVALIMGAINGGLRALQAKTPVPSPEPDEGSGGA